MEWNRKVHPEIFYLILTQLIRNAGYDINWAEVDGDLLMIATIQSAQGVTDLLKKILIEAVSC